MVSKDPIQKKIDERIKIKDEREDFKQVSITVAWAINCAVEMTKTAFEELPSKPNREDGKSSLENWTDYFLDLFDRKRSAYVNKRARKLEKLEEAVDSRDLDDANYSSEEVK